MPLVTLESLAAGTPTLVTKNHSMGIKFPTQLLREVDPNSEAQIRESLAALIAAPPSADSCKQAVRQFSWDAVAKDLIGVYQKVLSREAQ
jgi:glycosyltransferase involved in cell wall biosynthesis